MRNRALSIIATFALMALPIVLATPAAARPPCDACSCDWSCDVQCWGDIAPLVFEAPTFNSERTATGFTDSVVLITCGAYGVCAGSASCTTPTCGNLSCTANIYGTSGGDTLNGTSSRECIYGYGGADTIYGQAGDDRIYAGDGNDTVFGGSGDDCLWGEGGDDYLSGDTGYDFIDGGPGYDTCYGETKVSCP